jgi:flagellar biosynthesis/type III secretory pathway chaperone
VNNAISNSLEKLFDDAMQGLRRMLNLLDDEHNAITSSDAQSLLRISKDKAEGLALLSLLQTRLRHEKLPTHLPVHDFELLLSRCQHRNQANGVLLNLQFAQRQAALGDLAPSGYGPGGQARLGVGPRPLVSV